MFIKRDGKNDALIAGMVINDIKTKEYNGETFYEVPVSMGRDADIINVAIWNRKPEEIKKYDRVLACGQLKIQKATSQTGEEKMYYSLTADFICKEKTDRQPNNAQEELEPIDDDKLPF